MAIGREDGIENMLDLAVGDHEGETFDQGVAVDLEGGEAERPGQREVGIAQERERQVQAAGHLTLFVGGLGAQTVDVAAECLKLGIVIPKGTRFGGAAARAPGIAFHATSPPGGSASGVPVRG